MISMTRITATSQSTAAQNGGHHQLSGRGQPPQPDQLPAGIVQPGAHPGSGLHLEPHQLLLHARLPASIRTRSGPASTAAPVDGSSSTNSSSTPSVIAPAARTAPAGHRAPSRPVLPRPIRA